MENQASSSSSQDSSFSDIGVVCVPGNAFTCTLVPAHEKFLMEKKGDDAPKGISVFDVAAYVLLRTGLISTVKLQKLVYYCQAWSLVWDDAPLFPERIEAWVNGPVVAELFAYHKGRFQINSLPIGSPEKLNPAQKETIDAVVKFYGGMTAQQLVDISHLEEPWILARKGLAYDERGNNEISLESMCDYYSRIYTKSRE